MAPTLKRRFAERPDRYQTVNAQTANYTLQKSDDGKVVRMAIAGANTVTVPPNSAVPFRIGTEIRIFHYGAGQTTITPGAGVTLRSAGGKLKTNVQYSEVKLRKIGPDEWAVTGDTAL